MVLFGLACTNFILACAPNGNSGGPAALSAPGAPQGSRGSVQGTSDSGGGTGIEGKVFESYIVDPTELPAFKQHLQGLLNNLRTSKGESAQFDRVFKIKTWYIAPVELDRISKNVLGVSFMKSDTQQIARQTMKEVWIDKTIFEKMNTREQAELLLHELVMNLYFFKFMSISDFCRLSTLIFEPKKGVTCPIDSAPLEKMLPAEKAHPLTEQDNENIRFATGWLIHNATKPIPQSDFARVLILKGFDKRFFRPENYDESPRAQNDLKISRREFLQALQGAKLSGHMPEICVTTTSDARKTCRVEFNETQISFTGVQFPGLSLRVTADGETPIELSSILWDEVHLSVSHGIDDSTAYIYTTTDWRSQIRMGDRIHTGFFLFRKENQASHSPLILDSIVLLPGIVVSIDKKREPICQLRPPRVTNFFDDGLIIRRAGAEPSNAEQVFSLIPPLAACNSGNVVE
jgi:hypothetical protein